MIADAPPIDNVLFPKMLRRATLPTDIPDGFASTITPALGHEVHWLMAGGGHSKQMVLIHGALASRRYLLPTAELLAKKVQVFVPEMPGHGSSSRPRRALSVVEQAEVLYEWFRASGISSAYVFANSYGCQVAAQLTANHPEIVERLILSGPTSDRQASNLMQQAYRLYIDGFGEPKGAQGQLFADLSDMSIPIAFETANIMVNDDIRHKLARIKCRTLVVRGEKDTIAPQRWTEEVTGCLADARMATIMGAPHCVNYATPAPLTEMLMEFIDEI